MISTPQLFQVLRLLAGIVSDIGTNVVTDCKQRPFQNVKSARPDLQSHEMLRTGLWLPVEANLRWYAYVIQKANVAYVRGI
jgi:hypothetical protein